MVLEIADEIERARRRMVDAVCAVPLPGPVGSDTAWMVRETVRLGGERMAALGRRLGLGGR